MKSSLGLLLSPSVDHVLFSVLGISVSLYALYIEVRKSKDKNYKAACDLSESMSCSRVLTSKYSKGFGMVELLLGKEHFLNLPNCILGIVFYSLQLLLGMIHSSLAVNLLFFTSILSCLGSVYLAIVLFVILKDVCLVCMATYIINGILLFLNYQQYMYATSS
ncbi:vitamin K epoxide reductase complex subunit 1-like [Actinia tenebrosa]|uniref:vitamin-K-epoxide reductase (warfarin-sensitive) n=1 Tax=Actinia tenebrosa TaxID=6105 RepID=A0A6P8HR82_ACTTE|nr:vitamin K epoxide reductase complex subunit 1-like [Actinia tenebrosa]